MKRKFSQQTSADLQCEQYGDFRRSQPSELRQQYRHGDGQFPEFCECARKSGTDTIRNNGRAEVAGRSGFLQPRQCQHSRTRL